MKAFKYFFPVLLLAASAAHAQVVFELTYLDPPGVGFFDEQAVDPVPGNPGTTLGEQRRNAMERTLSRWSWAVHSDVPVRISAQFLDFGCDGFAGTGNWTASQINAPNAFFEDTWEQISMANARAGERLLGDDVIEFDAQVRFNLVYDDPNAGCETPRIFHYGLDPQFPPPFGEFSFLALAVHEVGHTLGFGQVTNLETGAWAVDPGGTPRPDSWSHFLKDAPSDTLWLDMTDQERVDSLLSEPNLVWSGAQVTDQLERELVRPPEVKVSPDVDSQDRFPALIHALLPVPEQDGIEGDLVAAEPLLACDPIDSAVSGAIALVRRGACNFVEKQNNALQAGAIAVVMVDSIEPGEPTEMVRHFQAGGLNVELPFWSVSKSIGDALIDAGDGLQATLRFDPDAELMGTTNGMATIYAPEEFAGGSTGVHFGLGMFPPPVMQAFISNLRFRGELDLSPWLLRDIGWPMDGDRYFHDRFESGVNVVIQQ